MRRLRLDNKNQLDMLEACYTIHEHRNCYLMLDQYNTNALQIASEYVTSYFFAKTMHCLCYSLDNIYVLRARIALNHS